MEVQTLSLDTQSLVALAGVVVALVVAIVGGVYKVLTDTNKYELTERYRQELLAWYSSTVRVMIAIIHAPESGEFFTQDYASRRTELLAELSALTEVGRFYFPNVDKGDGFGEEKPAAYRGYRNVNLEFMLYFYEIASRDDCGQYTYLLWKLERSFTSAIFEMVDPRARNKDYAKHLDLQVSQGESLYDFIQKNPGNIETFRR